MACSGVVFEVCRGIECDGEDDGDCFAILKTGDNGNYIKMGKEDSDGKYQLSLKPLNKSPPPPEC